MISFLDHKGNKEINGYDNKNNPYINVYPDYYKRILLIGKNNRNKLISGSRASWIYEYDSDDFPSKVDHIYNGTSWETKYKYE